jgi:AAA ATPase domain
MAAKTIVTPVLKFWGFERHPFDDLVLRGDELDLFIDRKVELRRLQNSLSHSLCGVFGTQGVGKSSVLNRLVVLTLKEGYAVATVQMTARSENLLYREILAAILREIKAGNVKVAAKLGLKVDQELERVQSSIKYTSSVEASGEAGWKALLNLAVKTGIKKQAEREAAKHTEDTAVELIRDIAQHKKEPFVVVIDNLERAKYMLNSEDAYFRFITKFAQTVDTTFAELRVPFVVSLDQSFPDRIDGYLPGAEEAYSFSFGQLVEIGVFPPGDYFKIVNRRLLPSH